MYLIAEREKGYRAIPINTGDDWGMKTMPDGKENLRIILRIGQRHYQLYSTRTMVWRDLSAEDLRNVCREIIAAIYDSILHRQDMVDVLLIAQAVEKKYRLKQKCGSPEAYYGHPLDPKAQQLVDFVRVDHPDIIQMDYDPPADVAQEDLPY